jgi:hypothetical protein
MSLENRFSPEEQVLLSSIPALAGSVMSMAEGSGLGTISEMYTSVRTMMDGTKEFAGNEIIRSILPDLENKETAMDQAKAMQEKIKSHLLGYQAKSRDELKQHVLDDCKKTVEILEAKATPEEAQGYKNWVLNIAERVAKAAKEGGFLGFGGTQVSGNESQLFDTLAAALKVDRKITA